MDYQIFVNYLFSVIHKWTTHVALVEYLNFGEIIYSRITKHVKITSSGNKISYYPRIISKLIKCLSPDEFRHFTYEEAKQDEEEDVFYEIFEDEAEGKRYKKMETMVMDLECLSVVYDEVVEFDQGYKEIGICETYRVV